MIKVNLLRDTVVTQMKSDGATTAGVFGEGTRIQPEVNNKDVLVKFIMMVAPLVTAYGVITYQESEKKSELNSITQTITAKQKEKEALTPEIKAVDLFKKEKEKVQQQIDTVRLLSKERLRNVKALEALQNLFPERAWLSSFKVDESKAIMEGSATDDQTIAQLMSALEENIYFASVRLIKSAEQATKEGAVKTFSIECRLEGM